MSIFARKTSCLFRNFVNNNANIFSQVLCARKGSRAWSSDDYINPSSGDLQPQGVNPKKGWAFRRLHKGGDPMSSLSLEELEQEIKEAKEDVWAKEEDLQVARDDLAAAKRSGNEASITTAKDAFAACMKDLTAAKDAFAACEKHLTALTEKQLLVLKQKPMSKSFAEANYHWIASVTGINPEYKNWVERSEESPDGYVLDEAVKPRDGFKAAFEEVSKVFHMENEAGRRIFLNLFLRDVVVRFDGVLRIFREVDMVVESGGAERRRLGGKIDYAVGFGKGMDIFEKSPRHELHLVALEAKTSFAEDDFRQCVAETATLYKLRVDARKTKKTVWGILSNAIDWEFIHIDDSGSLWRSEKFHINLKCYEEAKILRVYRFIHYAFKRCFECCTTPNRGRKPSRLHFS